jgi:hypothetical protein
MLINIFKDKKNTLSYIVSNTDMKNADIFFQKSKPYTSTFGHVGFLVETYEGIYRAEFGVYQGRSKLYTRKLENEELYDKEIIVLDTNLSRRQREHMADNIAHDLNTEDNTPWK